MPSTLLPQIVLFLALKLRTSHMTTFGARLKKARLTRGVTQERLGNELGVTKATISSWESNRNVPQFQKLEALRNALAVDIDYLVCNSVATRNATKNLGVREAEPSGYAGGAPQTLSPRELNLLNAWRAMAAEQQNALLVMLRPPRSAATAAKRPAKASA